MTPQAHRVSPCPGCATCRTRVTRGDLVGLAGILLLGLAFVLLAFAQTPAPA
jgi:hypothetical protein